MGLPTLLASILDIWYTGHNLWPSFTVLVMSILEFQSRTCDLQPKDHRDRPWFDSIKWEFLSKKWTLIFQGWTEGWCEFFFWALYLHYKAYLVCLHGISVKSPDVSKGWIYKHRWDACVHLWFHVRIYVMFCYITLDYIKLQYVMSWCNVLLCHVMQFTCNILHLYM